MTRRPHKAAAALSLLLWAGGCDEDRPAARDDPPDPVVLARTTAISGDVRVRRAAEEGYSPAQVGLELHDGDRVLTGNDGQATLTFGDGQRVMVAPESLVAIEATMAPAEDSLPEGPKVAQATEGVAVQTGQVEVELDPTAATSMFRIRTPDAEGIVPLRKADMVGSTASPTSEQSP